MWGWTGPTAYGYNKNVKTLRQSLIDYEMARLQAIAHCRGVALDTVKQAEAVTRLAEALLSPADTAIMLTGLADPAREALRLLLENGGRVERARFARQYGPIRPMGPARLEREKPWQNPANPAEELWYRGLIFKAFVMTAEGSTEVIYIPDDVRPLLNITELGPEEPEPPPQASLPLPARPAPAQVRPSRGRLRENLFSLLVYLQTTPVRVARNEHLAEADREALARCLLPELWPGFSRRAELECLLHLARRAGLLVVAHRRLRPDPDPTRAWLQAPPARQVRQLQKSWRADPTWNDLWHVPGLVPQPTGWENSPLLARSKILDYLAQVEPEAWLAVDDFVAAIKQEDPDFQRPAGDYESWYIQDEAGRLLMGFEHWQQVEGGLIRYLLTGLLPALEAVEVGLAADNGSPAAFRLLQAGADFLHDRPLRPPDRSQPVWLRVEANFRASVPGQTSLYDRFQLARFATLERREPERAIYHITQASVGRAMRNGVTADQMVAFLSRATNNQTPLKVVEALRTWGRRRSTARLERATLLRVAYEGLIEELREQPRLAPLLGEQVGPTALLIPEKKVAEVRRLLLELGYLEGE